MISISVVDDQIIVDYNNETESVKFSEELFNNLKEVEAKFKTCKTFDEVKPLFEEIDSLLEFTNYERYESVHANVVKSCTGEYYIQINDITYESPLPQSLVDRILISADKNIDINPLIKFWLRWLRNPVVRKLDLNAFRDKSTSLAEFINMKYINPKLVDKFIEAGVSIEEAYARSSQYQIKITEEGLLSGYKVCKEVMDQYDSETGEVVPRYTQVFDINTGEIVKLGNEEVALEDRLYRPGVMGDNYDPFVCKGNGIEELGHFIRVGCTHYLESWDQVNTNDYEVCVPGLHFGGLYYINSYSGIIHEVFVDPMHIGAIPDSKDGAIRCIQYFSHGILEEVNNSIYHSSTYAEETDAQWGEIKIEAQDHLAVRIEELKKESNRLNTL